MSNGQRVFHLGLVVNPYAGVGGPAGQKGSDEGAIVHAAATGQLPLTAPSRASTFLRALLQDQSPQVELVVVTAAGAMGADICAAFPQCSKAVVYTPAQSPTTRDDTCAAVASIVAAGIDLLVFVGGDGTARDVYGVVGCQQVALGVPAGVKMHSGVYAVNPQLAAAVVVELMRVGLVNLAKHEVRDIDEQAFRQGIVKSRFFGEMLVPEERRFVQAVKQGGFQIEETVLWDIAEHIKHNAEPNTLFIMGPGSTTLTIAKNWGLNTTLLGVDILLGDQILVSDANAQQVSNCVADHDGPILLVLTVIGGQGHIIGRGNQQITVDLLRRLGRDRVCIVATRTKLLSLQQRPLVMDSGDPDLDREWQGYIPVLTGFDDTVFYPLGYFADA